MGPGGEVTTACQGDITGRRRGAAREDHEARMYTKVDRLVTSALLRLDEGS